MRSEHTSKDVGSIAGRMNSMNRARLAAYVLTNFEDVKSVVASALSQVRDRAK